MLWVVLVLGAVLQSWIAMQPLGFLLGHNVPDDAFYVFTVARNIAGGFGSTFDRIAPTNGYHPLWMGVGVLPYYMDLNGIDALRALLFAGVFFNLCAAALLYLIAARRLACADAAAIAVSAWYLLSPVANLTAAGQLNGIETSLNCLVLLACIDRFLAVRASPLRVGSMALLGVFLGFAFLARTDNVIFASALYFFLLWTHWRESGVIGKLFIGGLASIAVSAPWVIWNVTTFHALVQTSGKVLAQTTWLVAEAGGWWWPDTVLQVVKNLADLVCFTFALHVSKTSPYYFLGMAALAFTVWADLRWSSRAERALPDERSLAILVLSAILIFYVIQTLRTIWFRPWYHFSWEPVLLLVAARILTRGWQSPLHGAYWLTVGILVLFATATWLKDWSGTDWALYRTLPQVRQIALDGGTKVGVWNAGFLGYGTGGRSVVNLDGSVNNQIGAAIRSGEECEYLCGEGIRTLVDYDSAVLGAEKIWKMDGCSFSRVRLLEHANKWAGAVWQWRVNCPKTASSDRN